MVEARKRRTAMMAMLLATALLVVGCSASGPSSTAAQAGTSGQVKSLTDVAQLQDKFNQGEGSVRLVLLLSPT